jgi:hypothetical protein
MIELGYIRRLGRIALTTLCIGAAAGTLSAWPLGNAAEAKNSDHGGQGADHGGGRGGSGNNGGGNSNGHSLDHSAGPASGADSGSTAGDRINSRATADQSVADASLSAHGLGKLNGFFHASPQALANASPNSSIGRISQTFRAALSAMAAVDQSATGGTAAAPTEADLGAILADATNKPVTAAQVRAIAARLAGLHPEDQALSGFAASADDAECQKIADAANAARTGAVTSTDTTTTE